MEDLSKNYRYRKKWLIAHPYPGPNCTNLLSCELSEKKPIWRSLPPAHSTPKTKLFLGKAWSSCRQAYLAVTTPWPLPPTGPSMWRPMRRLAPHHHHHTPSDQKPFCHFTFTPRAYENVPPTGLTGKSLKTIWPYVKLPTAQIATTIYILKIACDYSGLPV